MNTAASNFIGTGVAIVTPFRNDDSIDFKALSNIVNFTIENKVDYIVVLGTTGESVTLNNNEKQAVINSVIEANNKRVPLVVGIGGNNTQEVVSKIKGFDFKDIDAILSVAPYYNKPSQNGIIAHYKAIATATNMPIIMYNVPGRTGVNIEASTTLQLANEVKNIVAMKEASGNMGQIMDIIKNKPQGFELISGDDALTLPILMMGGTGVISVVANAYPKQFAEMVRLALNNNYIGAKEMHYKLLNIINALYTEGSPAGVKAVMAEMKLLNNHVRLPLVNVSNEHNAKLIELMKGV